MVSAPNVTTTEYCGGFVLRSKYFRQNSELWAAKTKYKLFFLLRDIGPGR